MVAGRYAAGSARLADFIRESNCSRRESSAVHLCSAQSPMKPRVYVETTIPTFYHEVRDEPEMVARRDWTRQWWQRATADCELVTSVPVVDELERGDFPNREECLRLIAPLPLLAVEPAVLDIVQTYIARRVMPRNPVGDALHLALASHTAATFSLRGIASTWRTPTNSPTFGE